jgi:DNA-binding NtrC family response regulator/Tfp pilus assembly protein PilF
VPNDDRNRIAHLEERLSTTAPREGLDVIAELEMLADLYIQADSYMPALENIDRLLSRAEARTLSPARRAALGSKAVACRIARGDLQAALAQCRELLRGEAEIDNVHVRAQLHLQSAEALFRLSRHPESRIAAERAQALAEACGDLVLVGRSHNLLGRTAYRQGDVRESRLRYEEASAIFRRAGDEVLAAGVRNNLGLLHKNLCEWVSAIGHFTEAYEAYERNGRYAQSAKPLLHLGIVHQKSGQWDRALETFQRAQQIFLEVGDRLFAIRASIGIGNVARLQRRFVDAETALLGALEASREISARREEVLALEFLGELDYDRGRPEQALARYREALPLAQRIAPEGDLIVELERRQSETLCSLGQLDEAERACERAQRLARSTDDRLEYAVSHRAHGEIAWARGRREDALEAWETAVKLLVECRERYELGRTLLLLGRAHEDAAQARRALVRASALFDEIGATAWLEQSESELERAMARATDPRPARPASLLGRRHRAPSLVACSAAMRRVEQLARRAAITELSVLVTGETGTGKELVARTIHSLSGRAHRPFLAVNCGALRADLALSQLFGHRKGAFTGAHAEGVGLVEAAHGGTLFLDEVGELPHDVQVTLLRFLESGEYLRLGETQVRRADVRMIAATNRELRGPDGEKHFRRDLLFRLNEIEIRVPSLRERLDDVVPLARHFLAFYGGLGGPRLTGEAESVLLSYGWHGNVRELENVMKRVAALHAGEPTVTAAAMLPFLREPVERVRSLPADRARDERVEILDAYRRAAGNKSRVAELLGVSRKTLYARLKRLQIELP